MTNLFFDLPHELRQKIYEYDSTYQERYHGVIDSLPLLKKQQIMPGGERWIFVLVTINHAVYRNIELKFCHKYIHLDDFKYNITQ